MMRIKKGDVIGGGKIEKIGIHHNTGYYFHSVMD
jgi:hypothetical protein